MKIMRNIYILVLLTFVLAGYPPYAVPSDTHTNGPKNDEQEKVFVGDMNFVREKSGAERVCFTLSRFCNPDIFSIPGKKPRIVIDVKPVQEWHGKAQIQLNGIQIQQIRTHLYKKEKKLRIVLDLNPALDFMVEPRYYEDERLYCVDVFEK